MIVDWDEQFKRQPERYLGYRDADGVLYQVIDSETGYVWNKQSNGEWTSVE